MPDGPAAWFERTWQPVATGTGRRAHQVTLHEDSIAKPYRWRTAGRVLVTGLFQRGVPDPFIGRVFDAMEANPRHTFLVLTEHPERMRAFVALHASRRQQDTATGTHDGRAPAAGAPANIWLGVRVSDQQAAEARIPTLLDTPAAIRFVHCEPLSGPVDLDAYLIDRREVTHPYADTPEDAAVDGMVRNRQQWHRTPRLRWIIAGGGTAPDDPPMHLRWVRTIRDTCQIHRVPFHFTGHGKYLTAPVFDDPAFAGGRAYHAPLTGYRRAAALRVPGPSGTLRAATSRAMEPGDRTGSTWLLDRDTIAVDVGAAAAGRELDGHLHNALPGRRQASQQYIIHCPRCRELADEFDVPVPHTDDSVACAHCPGCGHEWGLDPGADASCRRCGGSGYPDAPRLPDLLSPRCPCGDSAPEPSPT